MKIDSFLQKFILWFVVALLLTLIIMTVAIEVTFRVSMNYFIRDNIYSMQRELDASVTEVVNECAYLGARIIRSENLEYLSDTMDQTLSIEERRRSFDTLVTIAGIDEDYFNNFALIHEDIRFGTSELPVYTEKDYGFLYDMPNRMALLGSTAESVIVGVYSKGSVSNFTGILLFYLNEVRIGEMCNPVDRVEGYSFIMRTDGRIISHHDKSLVGNIIIESSLFKPREAPAYQKVTINNVRSIVVTVEAELLNSRYDFNSCIISVLDYNYYFGTGDLMGWILLWISGFVFVIAVVFAIIRAKYITRPVEALTASVKAMETTQKTGGSILKEGDELKQLERHYDEMLNRIFDLVERNKKDMELQRKLELDALQMQINPHFLYNTLDAISWMAKIKKETEIDHLVMNLARFFRLSLHKGDKFITIAEEVEIVKRYLEIDKIRFPDRITEHFEVEEEILGCNTMKLVLQPLVENCLKYAFIGRTGNLWVRAYSMGEDIIFEVEDDGIGFEVTEGLFVINTESDSGYGLANVNERIKLGYGEGYGLFIQSETNKGTKATVKIKRTLQ